MSDLNQPYTLQKPFGNILVQSKPDIRFRQRVMQVIRGADKFISRAAQYVLMFSDDIKNLEFYNRNHELLRDKNEVEQKMN